MTKFIEKWLILLTGLYNSYLFGLKSSNKIKELWQELSYWDILKLNSFHGNIIASYNSNSVIRTNHRMQVNNLGTPTIWITLTFDLGYLKEWYSKSGWEITKILHRIINKLKNIMIKQKCYFLIIYSIFFIIFKTLTQY